jgi:hypothetical protein
MTVIGRRHEDGVRGSIKHVRTLLVLD